MKSKVTLEAGTLKATITRDSKLVYHIKTNTDKKQRMTTCVTDVSRFVQLYLGFDDGMNSIILKSITDCLG